MLFPTVDDPLPSFLRCPFCRQSAVQPDVAIPSHVRVGDLIPGECIKCPVCQNEADFFDWLIAAGYPELLFETALLCPCGGQYWLTFTPNRKPEYRCDRCEQVLVNEEASSGEL